MSSARSRHRRPGRPQRQTFWDYNETGIFFYSRGKYDLAIAELKRAVGTAVHPLATLYVNLGAAYLRNGMYGQACSSLEEGLHTDPDNQTGHVLLGQALLAMGDTGAARAAFQHAWELNPDSPEGRTAEEELRQLCQGAAEISTTSGEPAAAGDGVRLCQPPIPGADDSYLLE